MTPTRGNGPSPKSARRSSAVTDLVQLTASAADHLTNLDFEAWHFGDSIAFEGILAAATQLQRPELTGFAHGFVRAWKAGRGTSFRRLDCTAPGLAICDLYRDTGDEKLLDAALELGHYLRGRPQLRGVFTTWDQSPLREPYGPEKLGEADRALLADPGPGVFIDCLHFDPPFFAALGNISRERSWTDLAVEQAQGYIDMLQDSDTGLFHHFYLQGTGSPHILGWGRGQGWALLGLLDTVERAQEHPGIESLRRSARDLVAAMVGTQQPGGGWNAVVHAPDSGTESSTSAFMAVGLRRARDLGLVEASVAEPAIATARCDLAANLSTDGVLRDVSAAVWASTLDSHYHHVPKGYVVPWGQGPAVLALLEWSHEQRPEQAGHV
ncbi:unsaturated rhamnogalacturonyl hydrolase [Mycobacterium frederiksbergense]|uniref:Unsaturated rhamnogalacturonyl hydrolase n=1 Tax=Mycolicibacterium frederiksbergense TaxID=117567 RepID=A0ABT6L4F0_9MYCO|nr:glycoside hydrolase family 88 protein [Mycolicibacterium frederiksbergense]MDH6197827.1 unsaturated rhamnogalacturonyl hydrolase [Mycolicibacterium frederiksbergense]